MEHSLKLTAKDPNGGQGRLTFPWGGIWPVFRGEVLVLGSVSTLQIDKNGGFKFQIFFIFTLPREDFQFD